MNYQYRYGGSAKDALKTLYSQGEIPRFYRGIAPDLPSSRHRSLDLVTQLPMLVCSLCWGTPKKARTCRLRSRTFFASSAAACWRVTITPVDKLKTAMQVEGKEGLKNLTTKIRVGGPTVMFHGAIGNMSATFAGQLPHAS